MLFHTFHSQEERRKFGGSYFIEFQYCEAAPGTSLEEILSVDAIHMWKNDSLYLYGDDDNTFFPGTKIFLPMVPIPMEEPV